MTNTLVPQVDIKDSDDLVSILRRYTDVKLSAEELKALQKPVDATKAVKVRDDAQDAIAALSELLKTVEVPSSRRKVTPQELDQIGELVVAAKSVIKAAEEAVSTTKEAVFNHFDVALEDAVNVGPGELGEAVDGSGHYLIRDEVYVPGIGKRLTRELAEQAPAVNVVTLRQLWERGAISRADYFNATRHVDNPRVVDPEGFAALLKRKPELLPKIAEAIVPGSVSARFHVRPPKSSKG